MAQISQLLQPSAVLLDAPAANWEDAVRTAGDLLVREGATSPEYTEAMLDNVHHNGPYIVIAPGFAFAHARPSQAVHRTAMSWLRLTEPVEFGHPTNDPVTLVVALAATDDSTHLTAMKELARVIGRKETRELIDAATTPEELLEVLQAPAPQRARSNALHSQAAEAAAAQHASETVASKGKLLTVCGNGLGTSLFLKNTLEEVLDTWGWGPYLAVEATDTISARGKAKEADAILTSGEIAKTLGEVDVPVHVIDDFTDTALLDTTLRDIYDV